MHMTCEPLDRGDRLIRHGSVAHHCAKASDTVAQPWKNYPRFLFPHLSSPPIIIPIPNSRT